MTVTAEDASGRDAIYNVAPYDLLLKVPNITMKNVRLILSKVKDIRELSSLTADQLGEILDNKKFGESIIEFLTKRYTPETRSDSKQTAPNPRPPVNTARGRGKNLKR